MQAAASFATASVARGLMSALNPQDATDIAHSGMVTSDPFGPRTHSGDQQLLPESGVNGPGGRVTRLGVVSGMF